MFKKIIDAIVAFFKGPQAAPVVTEAPYKIETPVEVTVAEIAVAAPVVTEVVAPAKKARKPAAKKPVAAPLRKADEPKPKKPAAKKTAK